MVEKKNAKKMRSHFMAFLTTILIVDVHSRPELVADLVGTTTGLVLNGLDVVTSNAIIDLLLSSGLSTGKLIPYVEALNQIIKVASEFKSNIPSE